MKVHGAMICGCVVMLASGCALQEVRSKSKFGPEFRTKGAGASKSHRTRWLAQQGMEFKWDQGVTTAITYRRRDDDNGSGDHDNGVWFEFSFPIWKARKNESETALTRRLEQLERRLAELESPPEQLAQLEQSTASGE